MTVDTLTFIRGLSVVLLIIYFAWGLYLITAMPEKRRIIVLVLVLLSIFNISILGIIQACL